MNKEEINQKNQPSLRDPGTLVEEVTQPISRLWRVGYALVLLLLVVGIGGYLVYVLWFWPLVLVALAAALTRLFTPALRIYLRTLQSRFAVLRTQWERLQGDFDLEDKMFYDEEFLRQEQMTKAHPLVRSVYKVKKYQDDRTHRRNVSRLQKELKNNRERS